MFPARRLPLYKLAAPGPQKTPFRPGPNVAGSDDLAVLRTDRASRSREETMTATRTETDTFGPIEVASDRYWGAQAQRSLGNFKIGWEKQPLSIVRALGIVKQAAARANMALGRLDPAVG